MKYDDFGCKFCWDSRKQKDKEPLYFLDAANNMRVSTYCPYCGRKYGEVPVEDEHIFIESENGYELVQPL